MGLKAKNLSINYLLILILLISSCTNTKKRIGCGQFKNGKFSFHFKAELSGLSFLIDRKDSIQIETGSNGWITKLAVKWTGECSYETKLIESTAEFPDSIQVMRKKYPLKVEILNYTDNYYTFKAKRDNADYVLSDTMWVEK